MIRDTIVEGIFYPAKARALEERVRTLLAGAGTAGSAFAVFSPHGAFEKSGPCSAAAMMAAAARRITRVVLIGPVHRSEEDALFLPQSETFRTPLGDMPLDARAVETLSSCSTKFIVNDIPHLEEHCLEVQLPFIQVLFPHVAIVPILLGRSTRNTVRTLTTGLHVLLSQGHRDTLIVVSANLSVHATRPQTAGETDAMIALILRGDADGLMEGALRSAFHSCGVGCMAGILPLENARPITLLSRCEALSDAVAGAAVHYAAFALGDIGA